MGHDPVAASQVSVATMHDVEEAQRHDVLIQTVRKYLEGDSALPADEFRPHLRDLSVSASGLVVYQGREEARLVVPEELRQGLMRMAHDEPIAGHQGVARTMSRLAGQFWWPRIRKDVDAWVAGCSQCSAGKRGGTLKVPLGTVPASAPNEVVAMDVLQLPEADSGLAYVLVMSDYFTRFVVVAPLRDLTAGEAASQFLRFLPRTPGEASPYDGVSSADGWPRGAVQSNPPTDAARQRAG
eukprot:m.818794 g.818794  ORF g.818794 m.818794 type:complete len:240 (+) comp59388_c0_seq126:4408-5127(+)